MANDLQINVESNIARIRQQFAVLAAGIEEKATVRALNRAGDQAITAASREIRKRYNLKAATVRSQIKVRTRAKEGQLKFVMRIFSKRIPLIEFAATQTRKGVAIRILKGARKVIPHAFIATMRSGHTGVFVRSFGSRGMSDGRRYFRVGKGSRIRRDKDLPIAQLFTVSVPQMFLEKSVRTAVSRLAEESFVRNFAQQLKFLTRA